jgi:hypothetical protein
MRCIMCVMNVTSMDYGIGVVVGRVPILVLYNTKIQKLSTEPGIGISGGQM